MIIEPIPPPAGSSESTTNAHASPQAFQGLSWVASLSWVLLGFSVIGAVLVALACFPISEGWYEALIFLDHHGLRPYRDVEFLLPPVVILFFRFLDHVTHENFALNKIIGIVVALVDAGLIYYWIRKRFSALTASVVATLAFVVNTTMPSYTAADYHDLDQGFTTLTLILLLSDSLSGIWSASRARLLTLLGAGVALQFLLMTKQNIGVVVAGAYFAYMLWSVCAAFWSHRVVAALQNIADIALVAATFLLTGPFILWLANVQEGYIPFLKYLSSTQSKGSPLYFATRIVHDSNNYNLVWPPIVFATFVAIWTLAFQYVVPLWKSRGYTVESFTGGRIPAAYIEVAKWALLMYIPYKIFLVLFGNIATQDPMSLWDVWPSQIAMTGLLVDIIFTCWRAVDSKAPTLFGGNVRLSALRVVLFAAIIYANSFTSALSSVGLLLPCAYYTACVLEYVFNIVVKQNPRWARAVLFCLSATLVLLIGRLEIMKFTSPYSWWGMEEPPIYASSVPGNLPAMRGLLLDPDRRSMIDDVVRDIHRYTTQDQKILAYPDIPVFYYLADRLPMTRTFVQWFDVANFRTLIGDFRKIEHHPPRVIVEMSLPHLVYLGHESLLGLDLPQKPFAQYLSCMTAVGAFKSVDRFFYNRTGAITGTYNLRTARPLSASDVAGIAAVVGTFKLRADAVTGALGFGGNVTSMEALQSLPDQRARLFNGISIQGSGQELPLLLEYIEGKMGVRFVADQDNYILEVLVRQGGWHKTGAPCVAQLEKGLTPFTSGRLSAPV